MPEFNPTNIVRSLTLLLVGAALGILGVTIFVGLRGQGVLNLELMSIVINAILTVALIGLYFIMAGTQRRQTTLAEIERTPFVEISGYEAEGDDIVVYLSNYGNGTATNLELVTVSSFQADSEQLQSGTSPESLVRVVDEASYNYERSIQPHERRVAFTANPGLVTHRDMTIGGFAHSISLLREDDVEDVAFQLYVRYSTRTGNRYSIPLFKSPREIEVDKDQTFGDAYSVKGGVTSVPEFIPDPDYPLPPYLNEDAGHPPRRDEFDF